MKKIILNKIFLLIVILLPLQINAETIITNSVSVSANSSNGVNTAHVKTIHNGEVVEDTTITTTSPINHHSEYEDSSVKIQTNTNTDNEEAKLEKLNSLIKELLIILAHYEKLLAQ